MFDLILLEQPQTIESTQVGVDELLADGRALDFSQIFFEEFDFNCFLDFGEDVGDILFKGVDGLILPDGWAELERLVSQSVFDYEFNEAWPHYYYLYMDEIESFAIAIKPIHASIWLE